MAYEPSAAHSSHTALTFSPLDRASTAHPTAPTMATAVQMMMERTFTDYLP
ncbi:hypothetical protein [Nonomuraea rubra]|uniref:hypothetical protein n=1 Tax=Nonomuraea rubra TaxID=46180 RepID=UPI0031EB00E3